VTGRGWWPGTGRRRAGQSGAAETFGALGLPADPALTDDEVRMAWRRVAVATHPDRADGGDPAAFAAAAAAYAMLRTRPGRTETTADAASPDAGATRARSRPRARAWTLRWAAGLPACLAWRIAHGRPWRLAARVVAALATCAAILAVTGSRPAGPALDTGALSWLALTARRDLAPRPPQPYQSGGAGPG
jgi:hypothetical protein